MAATAAQLRHYQQNKELYKARAVESKRRQRQRNRAYVNALKQAPCVDCGESFPPCAMDFHHVDDTKERNVSKIQYLSLKRLQDEIDKCVLLCACCHRIRHYATVVELADTAGSNPVAATA